MSDQKLRIVRLSAENFKRLSAVEITPHGNAVVISGRNAQGKSSVLDSIAAALGGKAAAKLTTRPIRDGQESASVTVDLGDLRVTRTWKDGKSNLTVTSAQGAKYSSPQAMLDNLVGKLSFDPLAFAQQDDKAQLSTLLDLVDLKFDPVEVAEARRGIFDERTTVNREVRQLEAQLAAAPLPPASLPDEELSAASVLGEYREAQENANWQAQELAELAEARRCAKELAERRGRTSDEITRLHQQIANLTIKIAGLDQELTENRELRHLLMGHVSAHEPIDLSGYEGRLSTVEQTNTAVRAEKARRQLAEEVQLTRHEADALTAKLDEIDEAKTTALANAKMPIDGLAFDDNGVTYNGVPFKQASAAEQLRVSIAMALALNPNVRVVLIRDASLLDSANLRLIEEMAAERDAQIWLERVDESGQVGIVIEDGRVSEATNA